MRDLIRKAVPWLSGSLGPLLALAIVIVLFAALEARFSTQSTFLSLQNARTMAVQTSTVAVAALGMTLVIIAGGIDLSAGTALALSATVVAWLLRGGYPPLMALAGGVGTGMLCGVVNGVLIAALRVVPFIVTLGTMTIYLGIAKLIANETTVRPLPSQVPAWLPELVSIRPTVDALIPGVVPNFASGVWLALLLAAILALVLRYTVFGRHVFALGSNELTARLCGVNVVATKIAVYTLAGAFVGVAGIYQFARLSSGNPTSGSGMELKIIAAVVIGGASLQGGRGSVLGTLAGAAMMVAIATGGTALGFSNPLQDVLIGVIIVAAVALDQWRERRLQRGTGG